MSDDLTRPAEKALRLMRELRDRMKSDVDPRFEVPFFQPALLYGNKGEYRTRDKLIRGRLAEIEREHPEDYEKARQIFSQD